MSKSIKPVLLLADSQLLFWREGEAPFLQRARAMLDEDEPGKDFLAVYLGASNGDAPEFFDLFVAAMSEVHIANCRHIPARPEAADRKLLAEADLILLAGGDVRRGWDAFKAAGLPEKIMECYYGGALLVGVSAGAVQLGLKGSNEEGSEVFDTFRVVPFVIDAHDEPAWARLNRVVARSGEYARGFGIPTGGGALYHPDYSVEPVRHPLTEVNLTGEGVRQALLFPGAGAAAASEAGRETEPASEVPDDVRRAGAPEHSIAPDGVIEVRGRHRTEDPEDTVSPRTLETESPETPETPEDTEPVN